MPFFKRRLYLDAIEADRLRRRLEFRADVVQCSGWEHSRQDVTLLRNTSNAIERRRDELLMLNEDATEEQAANVWQLIKSQGKG